jgi:MFS superfamily sulfate permease-like transporter
MIDPWKRKTSLDRDLVAIGVGNLLAAMVGGLPMISEIVRSRANIDNGARTRLSDAFHGTFLLLAVALLPGLIHRIPLAALAAMLVYTGFRLAHPREFVAAFRIGPEQLIIYAGTLLAVLKTDLLMGVFAGIGLKIAIHVLYHRLPLSALFRSKISGEPETASSPRVRVIPQSAAVFTNWLSLRKFLERHGLAANRSVVVDFSQAYLVDHTVMEKMHEMGQDFARKELELHVTGLENHQSLSSHPLAARRKTTRV